MTGPVDYAPFPTDPTQIKADIEVRREAIRIMFAEITALKQHLARALGPEPYLEYMAFEAASERTNAMGVANHHQSVEDRSDWTLKDYLDNDGEWKQYLAKAGWKGPDGERSPRPD